MARPDNVRDRPKEDRTARPPPNEGVPHVRRPAVVPGQPAPVYFTRMRRPIDPRGTGRGRVRLSGVRDEAERNAEWIDERRSGFGHQGGVAVRGKERQGKFGSDDAVCRV